MHRIFEQMQNIIWMNIKENLPGVELADLEENGKVYYMNDNNGTACDWWVNDHLPGLMCFYKDHGNLGAAKLILYNDGSYYICLYGDYGRAEPIELEGKIFPLDEEMFNLAVCLFINADEADLFGKAIASIDTDYEPSPDDIEKFKEGEEDFSEIIKRKKLLKKKAFVSKKIVDEGWNVGYMRRTQDENEELSGWEFYAGNEDQSYLDEFKNIAVCNLEDVLTMDNPVRHYIFSEPGTSLVRVSEEKFVNDEPSIKIFISKRDD